MNQSYLKDTNIKIQGKNTVSIQNQRKYRIS